MFELVIKDLEQKSKLSEVELKSYTNFLLASEVNGISYPFFTEEERVYMLKELTKDIPGTEVIQFNGLLVDFVKETKADAVIRGIRNSIDFEYELPLAQANYKLDYKADTIFLATLPEHSYISSSAVRELVRYKGDIKGFVPDVVYQFIVQKFDYMI